LSEEAIAYATAVKVDAMTLMGRLLRESPKNNGGRPAKTRSKKEQVSSPVPTRKELGLEDRKFNSDAQALADLADQDPELHEEVRSGRTTVPKARRQVQKRRKKDDLERKAAEADRQAKEAAGNGERPWEVRCGDCLEVLPQLAAGSVDLVFADPQYNIGVDYGKGAKADLLPPGEYMLWVADWFRLCRDALKPDGSFWVLIGDEYAAEYGKQLKASDFVIRAWVKWYETFGVNCANNFNRCSRHLFYCVKDPKKFTFNPDAVNRLSDRQTKYNDRRADPGGKIWDDVWQIPRLVGTAKERIPDFPTQLPLALLRAVVGCSSDPGDLVLDRSLVRPRRGPRASSWAAATSTSSGAANSSGCRGSGCSHTSTTGRPSDASRATLYQSCPLFPALPLTPPAAAPGNDLDGAAAVAQADRNASNALPLIRCGGANCQPVPHASNSPSAFWRTSSISTVSQR
jgi:site-specific DNA-methyltransferase (adenine-specific)